MSGAPGWSGSYFGEEAKEFQGFVLGEIISFVIQENGGASGVRLEEFRGFFFELDDGLAEFGPSLEPSFLVFGDVNPFFSQAPGAIEDPLAGDVVVPADLLSGQGAVELSGNDAEEQGSGLAVLLVSAALVFSFEIGSVRIFHPWEL